jgi:hypothetical protein
MKKIILIGAVALFSQISFAQEVKSEIEIVNEVKTAVMTINADRFIDLKGFDWRYHLTDVFKNIPDEAVIAIRVNIGAKQLGNDIATLNNQMSLYERGLAKNKEVILKNIVRTVQLFIDDEQQGNNVDK